VWLQPAGEYRRWVRRAYHAYAAGKQTLAELSERYDRHRETLRRQFEAYVPAAATQGIYPTPVALVFDATFFGRGYGLLVYRASGRNIYWQEIDSEKIAYIKQGLLHLHAEGWQFSSFTIDGRRGVVQLLESLFPGTPIQLCLYHQKAIVRRYTTTRPKTECGKAIRALMAEMTTLGEAAFLGRLQAIKESYRDFLKERNEQRQFMHRRLRSALRSLTVNALYLYTWKRYTDLAIPNTTNSCDGSFAHWKAKVKIHRGLRKDRRAKMIRFLLQIS
jgi:hypothetical protein